MKRKVAVRCTAADDDEGSDASGEDRPVARRRQEEYAPPSKASQPANADAPKPKKKEKEFAWMDSEDEDEEEGEEGSGTKAADEGGGHEASKGDGEEDEEVTIEALEAVQSFGRMMLLSEAITKRLKGGTMGAEELGATCRAVTRTKFFDGDMLKDLKEVSLKTLASDQLSIERVDDLVMCLWGLNAYDQVVYSSVAKAMKPKVGMMEQKLRFTWLQVYKDFNHAHEKDFLQLLEVPPLGPTDPRYRKIRCPFLDKGKCYLGDMCTYSHDARAPLTLEADAGLRSSPLVMTQNQYNMGRATYGGARNGQLIGQ